MTDLLIAQAQIKSRRKALRDPSGQFITTSAAIQAQVARERCIASLRRDVEQLEHAAQVAYVHRHFRPLPHADKPVLVASTEPAPTLFEVAA